MAQLINYKTENQIYNDFMSLVKAAFAAFDIKGWEVRQLNQPFKVNVLKPSVFITVGTGSQRGRQYNKNLKNGEDLKKQYSLKQEITIKFSAARRELQNDTLTTLNSKDILKLIKSYMQSDDGIIFLSGFGYAQYRAEEITSPFFTNDDDNFELLPSFNCTFVYTDKWSVPIHKIEKVINKGIHKI